MYLICDYKGIIAEVCEKPAWIKRQSNGVDVLCPESEATALYSNDTDSYYPAGKAAVSGIPYHLVEVDSVPTGAGKGWKYENGQYSRVSYIPTPEESAQAVARMSLASITDQDTKLKVSGLYPDWAPGSYQVGDIYNTHQGGELGPEWDQTWEVGQGYNSAEHPDIVPGNSAWHTFNHPLHGKSPETARPWVKPSYGTTDTYKVGEYMIWTDGDIYTPTRETNYSPEEYAPDWTNWTKQQGGATDPDEPDSEDGSKEHPITAARGMTYTYGLYYHDPEDSKTYLCKRQGEEDGGTVELQFLPHELVGQYFEEVVS